MLWWTGKFDFYMNSVCWLKCGGCWCQEQKIERGKTDPLRKDQPIWRTHTQIEQNFNRFPSTLSTLPWEADGQAAWKILLNFIQFSDSSYWMFMPDIFDAWQSASSRWGCDQNLTSKHAEKLRSNCAIQCWLNKNFLWQPLSKQFEGKEKGQESTRQTANQAISASKMFTTGGNKAKPRHPLSVCADCGASSPSWASVSRGVLICADCASVHRSLGRHISHVKCLNQGSWIPEQLRMVQSLYSCGANRCVLF